MFVELGSTTEVWRAHIVRGILGTYGIGTVLWHEHAAHLYGPGWGARGIVLVHEDDVEDAVEVLRAAPEEFLETGDSVTGTTGFPDFEKYPGLRPLIEGCVLFWTAISLFALVLNFVMVLFSGHGLQSDPAAFSRLIAFVAGGPVIGVLSGVLATLLLLPFRYAGNPPASGKVL